MSYVVENINTGDILDECSTYEQGEEEIKSYEDMDRADGTYIPNQYRIRGKE